MSDGLRAVRHRAIVSSLWWRGTQPFVMLRPPGRPTHRCRIECVRESQSTGLPTGPRPPPPPPDGPWPEVGSMLLLRMADRIKPFSDKAPGAFGSSWAPAYHNLTALLGALLPWRLPTQCYFCRCLPMRAGSSAALRPWPWELTFLEGLPPRRRRTDRSQGPPWPGVSAALHVLAGWSRRCPFVLDGSTPWGV